MSKQILSKACTHGMAYSSEYTSYYAMKTRCTNPNSDQWGNYGGRGVMICDRWMNSFENFFEDMGAKPSPLHSIDRIDPNGNYEPLNCRWATKSQQSTNQRPRKRIGITKKCLSCGKDIYIIPSTLRKNNVNYCSHECRYSQKIQHSKICLACNKEFDVFKCQLIRKKYCSLACRKHEYLNRKKRVASASS